MVYVNHSRYAYMFHVYIDAVSIDIWASAWDFQQCGMCDHQRLRPACAYPQSDQSLCKSLEYSVSVKLLTKHHLEFLSLTGGCTGSSESTLVKMPHCWKSHIMAHLSIPKVNLKLLFKPIIVLNKFLYPYLKHLNLNRGSYMSAHVLLNLLTELRKRDKMRGLPSILFFFRNGFNKFKIQ